MNIKVTQNTSLEHLESSFNCFNRKVKFEQDNDFAQKLIIRMNEARKKKVQEGAKDEFISEEVEKQRKKNELEMQEYEKEITKIKKQQEGFLEESIEVNNRTMKISESNTSLKSEIDLKKREWKKKTDLIKELQILQKQGVGGLDKELADLEKNFQDLQKQWEDYQKPIQEEIYEEKNKLKDMKLEYGFKQEQISQIKKNIKKSLAELKYKKEMLKFMEEEYSKLPKDINRNQYIKRINDVVSNVKVQQEEIQNTLNDINNIQSESTSMIKKISKMDKEVEDMLFKSAQKEKLSKSLYEEYVAMKDSFNSLIMNIQNQNILKNTLAGRDSIANAFKKDQNDMKEQKASFDIKSPEVA